MNITSAIDLLFYRNYEKHFTSSSLIIEDSNETDFINTTITTIITTTTTIAVVSSTTTTASNIFLRLFNSTKTYSLSRPTLTTTSSLNKYFLFKSPFNRTIRIVELCILSLTLPLYLIVFILFIQLTVQRISSNTTISGGGSRSRSQRRRQRMRSLIWTSNYLLVDFLGLVYEVIYVIIHLTGDLPLNSFAGRFYCQLQVYLPLYLTVLMAYSLTAISIYRRRHFVNLNNQKIFSTNRSIILVIILWILPIITSIIPAYLLTRSNILRITQHETTNECQVSYTSGSDFLVIYVCYRLGNIFLLPLSISFACYLTICIDLIRMQRRFTRTFKRHVHIRKNLILQILFLFLNFAVFWLPAEIITLYTKSRLLKDTVQVTKSLNILLDPLIVTGFDTRFYSAAQQLISKWRLEEFICFFNTNRQTPSSTASFNLITTRTGTTIRRLKQSTLRRPSKKSSTQQQVQSVTWNIADNDDITVLESASNHVSTVNENRPKIMKQPTTRRKPPTPQQQPQQRRRRQLPSQNPTRRQRSSPARVKITTDNHHHHTSKIHL